MMQPALRFRNIVKRYDKKTVLHKCPLDFCAADEGAIDIFGVSHRKVRFIGSPLACRQQFAADTLEQAFLRCIA